jgi:hypothetical protein
VNSAVRGSVTCMFIAPLMEVTGEGRGMGGDGGGASIHLTFL